ncbi:MAG: phosphatase PAP2 family protein [Firmicutes bacterium]|nr:phosphatase PAP2 family protein [Bacillota bacterium]
MESPPVRRPYFSAQRSREIFWLVFSWAVVALCALLLWRYWDWSRSMEMTNYLQQFRSSKPVEYLFRFFTFLGEDEFYMIFFGILIWCFNKSLGFWAAAVLLCSGLVSSLTKDLFALGRPVLEGMKQLESYAFPSGHTLTAVTVWGYLGMRLRQRWFWIWTLVVMVLTPFSRIILGYHYPGDILGGYVMGIPLLLLLAWVSSVFVEKGWEQQFSRGLLLFLALLVPVLLTVLHPQNDIAKMMGLLAGAAVGYIIEQQKVRASPRSHWALQLLKAALGLAVLFGIVIGLKPLFSFGGPPVQTALYFLRYGLVGIWVTLLAPALFVALRLTPREQE